MSFGLAYVKSKVHSPKSEIMSDTIITVENLSKRYRLGTIGVTTLRESVERGWHRLCVHFRFAFYG